jgi:hypothetical protein
MKYQDSEGNDLPALPPLRTFRVMRDETLFRHEIIQAHTINPFDHHVEFVTVQYWPDSSGKGYTIIPMIRRSIWNPQDVEDITGATASETGTVQ